MLEHWTTLALLENDSMTVAILESALAGAYMGDVADQLGPRHSRGEVALALDIVQVVPDVPGLKVLRVLERATFHAIGCARPAVLF